MSSTCYHFSSSLPAVGQKPSGTAGNKNDQRAKGETVKGYKREEAPGTRGLPKTASAVLGHQSRKGSAHHEQTRMLNNILSDRIDVEQSAIVGGT